MHEQHLEGQGGSSRAEQAPAREGQSLGSALESLVVLIEHEVPEMRGSVLLLDDDGVTLRHGAAPHLPLEYCRLIDGERIGPSAGSCGTAAFTREM